MSPATATLKCPYGTGEDTYGAQAAPDASESLSGIRANTHLMGFVEGSKIPLKEAGKKLGFSYCQATPAQPT
jgi:hypothetical protein